METMACLTSLSPVIKRPTIVRCQFHNIGMWKVPVAAPRLTVFQDCRNNLKLRCSKMFHLEASSPFSAMDNDRSIIEGTNVVEPIDTEEAPQLTSFEHEQDVVDMKKEQLPQQQILNWPLWLLGPSVLLLTGMVPTLWLPLSSVFLGPNVASVLSLVGLDCIFNMGATLFFLMADACGRPKGDSFGRETQVPLVYKSWNLGASAFGFLVPLVMLMASYKGILHPQMPFISFTVLLGPYLLLLSIQILTELLTWHWRSPVWLVAPVVYEMYRVLQLMRGLKLGIEVGAPAWAMESIRVLVSWWVLVLGIQLMRVGWFTGYASHKKQQQPQA